MPTLPDPVTHSVRLGLGLAYGFVKWAADDGPKPAYDLSGRLYVSKSGWLLLAVPNALGLGVFYALDEPGVELPYNSDGKYVAHISVMRPEELEQIGGIETVSERGKHFRYSLGSLVSVRPDGWAGVERVWFLRAYSPDLQQLRMSYGLSALPDGGRKAFHVTVARRRRGVLGRTETAKAADFDEVAAALDGLTDDDLNGISVHYHPGPPELIYLDGRDWADSKVVETVRKACSKAIGDCARVICVNESEAASEEAGWEPVYPPPEEKAAEEWCVPATALDLRGAEACARVSLIKSAERRPFTVAADLDGTLAESLPSHDPGRIGPPRPESVAIARWLRDAGARILIHTVRGDVPLVTAWLKEHDVPFDFVNENPDQPPGASDKLIADVYWDDRAVNAVDPRRAALGIAKIKAEFDALTSDE